MPKITTLAKWFHLLNDSQYQGSYCAKDGDTYYKIRTVPNQFMAIYRFKQGEGYTYLAKYNPDVGIVT